jgi:endoglucanase
MDLFVFLAHAASIITLVGCTRTSAPQKPAPAGCTLPAPSDAQTYAVRFDQVGYLPTGSKWAVVMSDGQTAPNYRVYDLATGCAALGGAAGPRVLDEKSLGGTRLVGDVIDLSALRGPGKYLVALEDGSQFGPIVVDATAYKDVLPAMLQFFGAQRCGAVTPAISHHEPCHLYAQVAGGKSGDGIAVNDGHTAKVDRQTGPSVDVEGGWHDAGDHIKFLGTTAFVLAVDLLALRDHAGVLAKPEAGRVYERLRAEMRWGLDWVTRMLGGRELYHQVSGERDHDTAWRNPADDGMVPAPGYEQRPVFRFAPGQGGNLLGRAAAALALASQVYRDDPPYASRLLALARHTYAEGVQRPKGQNPDPAQFYRESTVDDDLALGAAVLAEVTGETSFRADALARARQLTKVSGSIYWGDLGTLALLETGLAFPEGSAERSEMAGKLLAAVKDIAATNKNPKGPGAAFRYALERFGNGSIEQSLGAATSCLAARRLDPNNDCVEVAKNQLHWLFGQNPFGVSFMIGLGKSFPKDVHHSAAQSLHFTLTGAIVGGPTTLSQRATDPKTGPVPNRYDKWSVKELFYEDQQADYVTNEPAIDFTAPLLYVLADLLESP